ncbi:hypothetical protein KFL_000010570 [Klebsormidium nitens]|uniref:Uncharacterized protein n=1 Tax=Klebsormidium nitens TaxID=105231 RepID=A0A0U9HKC1_KLENI|nr:hypothetical protein KFL_000010570 [Klebsormidium nitens]|eukprot:GAQ77608.1 hypothetical protein KFL_000010570 [Klebsormidium nitens]
MGSAGDLAGAMNKIASLEQTIIRLEGDLARRRVQFENLESSLQKGQKSLAEERAEREALQKDFLRLQRRNDELEQLGEAKTKEVRVRSEACSLLEIQLKKTQQERDESAVAERHLRSKLADLAETVDGLSRDNKELRKQLVGERNQAENLQRQVEKQREIHERSIHQLKCSLSEKDGSLQQVNRTLASQQEEASHAGHRAQQAEASAQKLRTELAAALHVTSKLQEQCDRLQEQVAQGASSAQHAQEAQGASERRCSTLEAKVAELEKELTAALTERSAKEAAFAGQSQMVEVLSAEKVSLTNALETARKDAVQAKDAHASAAKRVQSLQQELLDASNHLERLKEAEGLVAQLTAEVKEREEKCAASEQAVVSLQSKLGTAAVEKRDLESRVGKLADDLSAVTALLEDARVRLGKEEEGKRVLEARLEAQTEELKKAAAQEGTQSAELERLARELEQSKDAATGLAVQLKEVDARYRENEAKLLELRSEAEANLKRVDDAERAAAESLSALEESQAREAALAGRVKELESSRRLGESLSGALKREVVEKAQQLAACRAELAALSSGMESVKEGADQRAQELAGWEEKCSLLEAEAGRKLEQLRLENGALSQQLQALESQLQEARGKVRQNEEAVLAQQRKVFELEGLVGAAKEERLARELERTALQAELDTFGAQLRESRVALQSKTNECAEAVERLRTVESFRAETEGALKGEVARLEEALSAAERTADGMAEQKKIVERKLKEAEMKLEAATGLKDALQGEAEEAQMRLVEVESELEKTRGTLLETEERLSVTARLAEERAAKLVEAGKVEAVWRGRLEGMEADSQKKEAEMLGLVQEVDASKHRCAAVEQESGRANEEVAHLRGEVAKAKERSAAAERETEEKLAALEVELKKAQGELAAKCEEVAVQASCLAQMDALVLRAESAGEEAAQTEKLLEEAVARQQALEESLSRLSREKDERERRVRDLTEALAAKERLVDEGERRERGREAELRAREEAAAALERSLQGAQAEVKAKADKLAELESILAGGEKRAGELAAVSRALEEEKEALVRDFEARGGALERAEATAWTESGRALALEAQLAELTAAAEATASEVARLTGERDGLTLELEARTEQLATSKMAVASLTEKLDAVERELSVRKAAGKEREEGLQAELSGLVGRLDAAEAELSAGSDRLAASEERERKLQGAVEALRRQLDTCQIDLEAGRKHLVAASGQLAQSQGQLLAKEAEILELKAQFEGLEAVHSQQAARFATEKKGLEEREAEGRGKVEAMAVALEAARGALAAGGDKEGCMEAHIGVLERRLEDREREIETLWKEVAAVTDELGSRESAAQLARLDNVESKMRLAEIEAALAAANEQKARLSGELAAARADFERSGTELERSRERASQLEMEQRQREESSGALSGALTAAQEKLAAAQREVGECRAALGAAQADGEAKSAELAAVKLLLEKFALEVEGLTESREKLAGEVAAALDAQSGAEQQTAQLCKELEELVEAKREVDIEILGLKSRLEQGAVVAHHMEEAKTEVARLEAEVRAAESRCSALERAVNDERAVVAARDEKIEQLQEAARVKEETTAGMRSALDEALEAEKMLEASAEELSAQGAKAEKELLELQRQREEGLGRITELERQLELTQATCKDISAEKQALAEQVECGQAENAALLGKQRDLESAIQQLKTIKERTATELQAQLDSAVAEKARMCTELEAATADVAELRAKEKVMEGSLQQVVALAQKIDGLEKEKKQLQTAVGKGGQDAGALSEALAAAQERAEKLLWELNGKIQVLEAKNGALEHMSAQLQGAEAKAEEQAASLAVQEDQLQTLRETIAHLEDSLHSYKESGDSLQRTIGEREISIETGNRDIERLQTLLEEKRVKVEGMAREAAEASNRLAQVEECVSALQAQLTSAQKESNGTESSLKELAAALRGREADVDSLRAEKAALCGEVERFKGQMEAALKRREAVESGAALTSAELERVGRELEAMRATVSALEVKRSEEELKSQQMEAALADKDGHVAEARAALESARAEGAQIAKELDASRAVVGLLQKERGVLIDKMHQLEAVVTSAKAALAESERLYSESQEAVKDAGELRGQLAEATSARVEVGRQLEEALAQIEREKGAADEWQKKVRESEATVAAHLAALDALQLKVYRLQQSVVEGDTQRQQAEQAVALLHSQLEALSGEQSAYAQTALHLSQEVEQSHKALSAAQRELEALEDGRRGSEAAWRTEKETLCEEISIYMTQVEELNGELKAMRVEKAETEAEIADMRARLEQVGLISDKLHEIQRDRVEEKRQMDATSEDLELVRKELARGTAATSSIMEQLERTLQAVTAKDKHLATLQADLAAAESVILRQQAGLAHESRTAASLVSKLKQHQEKERRMEAAMHALRARLLESGQTAPEAEVFQVGSPVKVPGRPWGEDAAAEERVVEQELALRLQQAQAELRRANLEIDDMRTRLYGDRTPATGKHPRQEASPEEVQELQVAVKDLQSELALEKAAHNATKQALIEEQGRFATQLQELQELIQNMNGGAAGGASEMPPIQELAILRARVIELDMRLAMARSDGDGKSGAITGAAGQDFVLDASVEDGREDAAADGTPDVYELQKMVAAKEEELNYFVERCESLMRENTSLKKKTASLESRVRGHQMRRRAAADAAGPAPAAKPTNQPAAPPKDEETGPPGAPIEDGALIAERRVSEGRVSPLGPKPPIQNSLCSGNVSNEGSEGGKSSQKESDQEQKAAVLDGKVPQNTFQPLLGVSSLRADDLLDLGPEEGGLDLMPRQQSEESRKRHVARGVGGYEASPGTARGLKVARTRSVGALVEARGLQALLLGRGGSPELSGRISSVDKPSLAVSDKRASLGAEIGPKSAKSSPSMERSPLAVMQLSVEEAKASPGGVEKVSPRMAGPAIQPLRLSGEFTSLLQENRDV